MKPEKKKSTTQKDLKNKSENKKILAIRVQKKKLN